MCPQLVGRMTTCPNREKKQATNGSMGAAMNSLECGKNDQMPTVSGKNDHVSTAIEDEKQVTSDNMGAAIDGLESNRSGKNDHVPTVRKVQRATKSSEKYLEFIIETGEDFQGGDSPH